MRRVPTLALLAAVSALAAVPAARAVADPAPSAPNPAPSQEPPPRPEGDCARARKAGKPCQLTIGPEQVVGTRQVPDGADLRLRWFEPAGSLLRIRHDFVAQIVKSADDL